MPSERSFRFGEKGRECDRCGFLHPFRNLKYDTFQGLWLCTTKVVCADKPDVEQLSQRQPVSGFIFQPKS